MSNLQAAAVSVAAQSSCAKNLTEHFQEMGAVEQQPHFRPILRRELMVAVNTVSRDLGLRSASVVVLDALLSCLPCPRTRTGQDTPITPLTLLTVYAANDTLCFRAKNITDRQLRRHLERLEEVGLIKRRDSANGKRFPIKRGGKVVGAFGIDLSPLLERAQNFVELAHEKRQQAEELKGLKSRIQRVRSECLQEDLDEDAHSYVESTRSILRRVGTTLQQAKAILSRLLSIVESARKALPDEQEATNDSLTSMSNESLKAPGTDGQNVRHIESPKSETKKRNSDTLPPNWASLDVIAGFYPKEPRTEHQLFQVIYEFGRMLQIADDAIVDAVRRIGAWETLCVQNKIAKRIEQIENPTRYLTQVINTHRTVKVGHGQLC